jgi:hypothetical protein
MKSSVQLKTAFPLILITVAFACVAFPQRLHAVSPPPDGGYSGGNTAEGQSALLSLATGGFNTAAGYLSLRSDTTGSFNTAVGAGTLLANTADDNTATGAGVLLSNVTGFGNTANGAFALFNNTGGVNTAIGFEALFYNTTGSGNTALGVDAGNGVTTATSVICIGISGANVTNSCFIGNIYGTTTQSGTTLPVIVSDQGQLGTTSSSRRFKKETQPMDKASEAILALKPVTFHYKSDKTGTAQFGLIAEDVAAVNPDLVVRDKNGEIYTVRYDAVNAMLLNEFLKEHKKVEKQEATITRLKNDFQMVSTQQRNEIQLLSAQLKEQAAQIQKVTAQFEMSKPTQQVVVKNQ